MPPDRVPHAFIAAAGEIEAAVAVPLEALEGASDTMDITRQKKDAGFDGLAEDALARQRYL